MGFADELRTRNFSIYGQWYVFFVQNWSDKGGYASATPRVLTNRLGVLCIILCLALGIANIFHANLVIIFSIICM